MKRIKQNCIIPSAAFAVPKSHIKYFDLVDKPPAVGDLMYGEVSLIGHHNTLESRSARIHIIHDKTRAVFVFGNRYAPNHYEGFVPPVLGATVDLLSRSGLVGEVSFQNELISAPTKVRMLGYVCDKEARVLNTKDYVLIHPRKTSRTGRGSKLILCVGTTMNCGKSYAAAACCYALSSKGKKVRAAKITGTASLKDILLMEDCGAQHIVDFSYFGYPSTYMLDHEELMRLFHAVDMKYGNNPTNYLVVEFADGILQRETAMLLQTPEVRSRIHKLVFCAQDASGVYGGLQLLREQFDLVPTAISGVCSSSPLTIREIKEFTDVPILRSAERDFQTIYDIIK